MDKNDILVVQVKRIMSPDKLDELQKKLVRQKEEGVILIPPYCEVVFATDTDSLMEQETIFI